MAPVTPPAAPPPAPAPTVEPIVEPAAAAPAHDEAAAPIADSGAAAPIDAGEANDPGKPGTAATVKRQPVHAKPPIARREPPHPVIAKRVATAPVAAPGAAPAAAPAANEAVAAALPPIEPPHARAEPESPPVVAPPVPPVAPPVAPAVVGPVAPPSPGSLDAEPAITELNVVGSLSTAVVRRSLERTLSSMRGCYRTAAKATNTTQAVELKLAFEIDENSLATKVVPQASFGSLAACAANVAGQIRTPEAPDTGTARVTAVIRFRPS
jgi:hypothetical protein